jgi:hypothetical protein
MTIDENRLKNDRHVTSSERVLHDEYRLQDELPDCQMWSDLYLELVLKFSEIVNWLQFTRTSVKWKWPATILLLVHD